MGRRGRQRGEQEPEVSVARFCMRERRAEEERARAEGAKSRRKEENKRELFSNGVREISLACQVPIVLGAHVRKSHKTVRRSVRQSQLLIR